MTESRPAQTSELTRPGKPRERIYYLDLVRALATILIVITHFNVPYLAEGNYVFAVWPFGVYIGDLGVSLFLIVSGAALMAVYGGSIDLRRFYWKRFKSIYPMFWTAWILATAFFILARHGSPINVGPPASLIYTVLGIDGWIANFHVATFYLLGEWFLGFIIMFYLVFPPLRWGVENHPVITGVVVLALYVTTLWFFDTPRPYPGSIILTMRLPELAFGMYLIRYFRHLPPWSALLGIPALFLSGIHPEFNENIATTAVGISAFVIVAALARFVSAQPIRSVVALIATYSYAIFLVHHVVIMQVFTTMDPSRFVPLQSYAVFAAVCIVIFGLSVALYKLNDVVIAFVTTSFAKCSLPTLRRSPKQLSPASGGLDTAVDANREDS